MRVLLSTIGSRGDVQPLVALAIQLRELGQDVRLCVPPDFSDWIAGLGLSVTPIGPELRKLTVASTPIQVTPLTPERRREMMEGTVVTQFETIMAAAEGCDAIVGATALQIAAPSVAEKMGIPYVFVAFCPTVIPSPHHPPILLRMLGDTPAPAGTDNRELWAKDARRWNDTWGGLLNAQRLKLGLAPITDVHRYVLTERPWLAADPTLGPWPDSTDDAVFQSGAWILLDERPLSPELESFLDAGEPPIYFGFGSIAAPQGDLNQVMIQSARAVGRRAIVSRGWAGLSLVDNDADCIAIDEVNQQALFKRVAAVVHHGGAGTTSIAALSGAPQVVVPQMYDQPYWAQRVHELDIGTALVSGTPTTDSLTLALRRTLEPDMATNAHSVATTVRRDGANAAAQRLIAGSISN